MKKVKILFMAALFLAASLGIASPGRAAEEGVTWRLVNPMGGFEITQIHAPRLDDLAGKTICELSIDQWQAHRILPAVLDLLQGKYPTAEFVPFTEFPLGHAIDSDATAQRLKDRGCQAAIIASAA